MLPVSNEDNKWHAIAKLMWTRGWTRSICSREFVKQPVRGSTKALLMLLPISRQLNNRSMDVHGTYGPRPMFVIVPRNLAIRKWIWEMDGGLAKPLDGITSGLGPISSLR